MKITPLDLRQHRFRSTVRGFDRAEVTAFMTEAADDYEKALRELDHMRQEITRLDALLTEHRERETNLRNTLTTAQKLADDIRQQAQQEGKMIVREAQGRADLLLQKAQGRLEGFERQITELRLRRRDVEASLEASVTALQHALEFVRTQEATDEKIRIHRPRTGARDASVAPHETSFGADPANQRRALS